MESLGMEDKIFSAVVPPEKKIKIVGEERRTVEEKTLPGLCASGYDCHPIIHRYVVRNTPRVTGFVGSGTTPVPLDKKEVDTLLREWA